MNNLVVDFDDSGLVTGETYSYRVQARDGSGNLVGTDEVLTLSVGDSTFALTSQGDGWYGTDSVQFAEAGAAVDATVTSYEPGLYTEYWKNTSWSGNPNATRTSNDVWINYGWFDNVGPLN